MSSHDEDDDTMPQSKRVRLDDADVIDLYDSPTEDDDDHTVDISQWGINKLYADNVDAVHKVVKGLAADNVDQLVKANIKVIEHPFRVVQMKDFLKEETLLEVKAALPRLEYKSEKMDLFSYSKAKSRTKFEDIHCFFRDKVRPIMESITGYEFVKRTTVDISLYRKGDYLLCHDDQVSSRKVAFVLYMVDPEYNAEESGGHLELLECDPVKRYPTKVVHRLAPAHNMFIFFEVSAKSYHQVSEMLQGTHPRLSINGWFHVAKFEVIPRNYELSCPWQGFHPASSDLGAITKQIFKKWVSPLYLIESNIKQARTKFCRSSELQLSQFFKPNKLQEVVNALKSPEVMAKWKHFYCPVWCKYDYLPLDELMSVKDKSPFSVLWELIMLLHSETFTEFLSMITSLKLSKNVHLNGNGVDFDDDEDDDEDEDDEEDDIQCVFDNTKDIAVRGELRRWDKSYYSLLNDDNPESREPRALDLQLFIGHDFAFPEVVVIDESDEEEETDAKIGEEEKVEGGDEDKASAEVIAETEKEAEGGNEEEASPKPSENYLQGQSCSVKNAEMIMISDEEENSQECGDHSSDSSSEGGEDVSLDQGGVLTYIDPGSDFNSLLDVAPVPNSLNLVYRLKGVQRFMHYIRADNPSVPFFDLSFVYKF